MIAAPEANPPGAGLSGPPQVAYAAPMTRIWIASLAGIAGFCLYVMGAVALADRLAGLPGAVSALYFAVAGVLWVIPARWLMYWAAGQR